MDENAAWFALKFSISCIKTLFSVSNICTFWANKSTLMTYTLSNDGWLTISSKDNFSLSKYLIFYIDKCEKDILVIYLFKIQYKKKADELLRAAWLVGSLFFSRLKQKACVQHHYKCMNVIFP